MTKKTAENALGQQVNAEPVMDKFHSASQEEVQRSIHDRQTAEIERLMAERKAACNLLAVMHEDGGQYIDKVGFILACEHAETVRHAKYTQIDQLCQDLDRERDEAESARLAAEGENHLRLEAEARVAELAEQLETQAALKDLRAERDALQSQLVTAREALKLGATRMDFAANWLSHRGANEDTMHVRGYAIALRAALKETDSEGGQSDET